MAIQANLLNGSAIDITSGTSLPAKLLASVTRFARSVQSSMRAAHEVEELLNMSDRELKDLGIARGDIARTVYERNFENSAE